MSNIKTFNHQLDKAKNIKDIAALDFVKDRTIKVYEGIWGKKDGESWYQAEIQAMLTIFAEKPDLAKADKMSIWGCLMKAARENTPIHQGYMDLIMYGNVLKGDINYKGKRNQLRRMPTIKFVGESSVVYKEDEFEYDDKKKEVLLHKKKGLPKSMSLDNTVAAYVTIEFQDRNVDVLMWQPEIIAAKNKSKNKSEAGPWNQTPWEMCKKTVVNRANKIYYERPEIEVVGFNPVPEEKEEEDDTQNIAHTEVVDENTGEVTQQAEQTPPPQPTKPAVSAGMEEFLKND